MKSCRKSCAKTRDICVCAIQLRKAQVGLMTKERFKRERYEAGKQDIGALLGIQCSSPLISVSWHFHLALKAAYIYFIELSVFACMVK